MTIIFLLIGVSLLVALTFLGGFLWAVRNGQYDDTYTPSVRMLFEEDGSADFVVRARTTAPPADGKVCATRSPPGFGTRGLQSPGCVDINQPLP